MTLIGPIILLICAWFADDLILSIIFAAMAGIWLLEYAEEREAK